LRAQRTLPKIRHSVLSIEFQRKEIALGQPLDALRASLIADLSPMGANVLSRRRSGACDDVF
jgi:hypothetical protein